MTKHITLTNSFHGTQTTIRVFLDQAYNGDYMISRAQYRRAIKNLCGMDDCSCGVHDAGDYTLDRDHYHCCMLKAQDHPGGASLQPTGERP